MPTEKVEIGFDLVLPTGPFFTLDDEVKGKLDNTTYTLAGFQYYDVTQYVTDIAVNRGKDDYIANISSGELAVTLNNLNRYFDPTFVDSPFYGNIKPKRVVRYSVNGIQAYQGVIDDWNLVYDISGESLASFVASDGFVYLNNQTLAAGTATPELSGARVTDILDNEFVQWSAESRDIDPGTVTFGADVIPENTNVLSYLQQIELAELGLLFIGKDGTLVYRDRNHTPSTTSLVRFADDGTGIGYNNMVINYGSEDLVNEVVASSIITATETTASDTASKEEYGIFNETYTDLLLNTDAQVETFATTILAKNSQPVYSFKEIQVNLNKLESADLTAILNLELGDFVQVTFTPSNVPPAITRYAQVIRLNHEVDVSGDHDMTFGLNTLNFTYLVLDDTVFGRLDEGALF
jgi:hypothetical protein